MGASLLALSEGATSSVTVPASSDISSIIDVVTVGVSGVFSMAGSAFNFLFSNPLCAFMMCVGFAGVALGFVRRALRVSKRS